MIQSLLSNIAILLIMHLSMSVNIHFRKKYSATIHKLITILIISISVICMFYLPIKINDDYWIDMRLIPLVFLAYIQGWKVTIPSLIIVSLWRFFMGGNGMVPGIIFGMVLPTLFALLFQHRSRSIKHSYDLIGIVIVAWFISDFPIIYFMPNGMEIFTKFSSIRLVAFVITTMILYTFYMLEKDRQRAHDRLEKLADEDSLTKLHNKRRFFEIIERKSKACTSRQFLAMLDLDYFKHINDTYGHLVGDKMLIELGNILNKYEQQNVVIGRYGGEEFIVYIEEDEQSKVLDLIFGIQSDIRTTPFTIDGNLTLNLTVSIGISEIQKGMSLTEAVQNADRALYTAKESGRDRVVYDGAS